MTETLLIEFSAKISGMLTMMFIVLKVTGAIQWSWFWILAPTWIPLAILIAIVIVAILVSILVEIFK